MVKGEVKSPKDKNADKPEYTSENNPLIVDFVPDEAMLAIASATSTPPGASAEGTRPKSTSEGKTPRMGLCMAPGRQKPKAKHVWKRDLDADLTRLRDEYGADTVVTLLRTEEMAAINAAGLLDAVRALGMESLHLPVKDKFVPGEMKMFYVLVASVTERLRSGKCVVVHCNGGKGRSALVLVCVLIMSGMDRGDAIRIVQCARSGTIRNPLQQMYAAAFVKYIKHGQKKGFEKDLSCLSALDVQVHEPDASSASQSDAGRLSLDGQQSVIRTHSSIVGHDCGLATDTPESPMMTRAEHLTAMGRDVSEPSTCPPRSHTAL